MPVDHVHAQMEAEEAQSRGLIASLVRPSPGPDRQSAGVPQKCRNPKCWFRAHGHAGRPRRPGLGSIPAGYCCEKCWIWETEGYKRGTAHGQYCEKKTWPGSAVHVPAVPPPRSGQMVEELPEPEQRVMAEALDDREEAEAPEEEDDRDAEVARLQRQLNEAKVGRLIKAQIKAQREEAQREEAQKQMEVAEKREAMKKLVKQAQAQMQAGKVQAAKRQTPPPGAIATIPKRPKASMATPTMPNMTMDMSAMAMMGMGAMANSAQTMFGPSSSSPPPASSFPSSSSFRPPMPLAMLRPRLELRLAQPVRDAGDEGWEHL